MKLAPIERQGVVRQQGERMNLKLLALAGSLLISTTANAERVLITLKDNASFNKTHLAYSTKGKRWAGGLDLGVQSKVVGNLDTVLPSISSMIIDIDNDAQLEALKNAPGVVNVEKEIFYAEPKPAYGVMLGDALVPGNLGVGTPWGIHAVKAEKAWAASNSQGQGARVLVLDTGIDAKHASLANNFEKGRDFISSEVGYLDTNSHGTHVAGTIAGVLDDSGFVGVAPQAKILAGKVCDGGCSSFAIVEGILWGIEEKVDVISMSLGGAFPNPSQQKAIQQAIAAGIVVVAATGNDGTGNVSYPAAFPGVIAVGAIGDDMKKTSFSQFGPQVSVVAPGANVYSSVPTGTGRAAKTVVNNGQVSVDVASNALAGSSDVMNSLTGELVDVGLGKPENFAGLDLTGKIALISRGEIAFGDKVKNALKAKAAGVVIYNNEAGALKGTLGLDEGKTIGIPAFSIEQSVGLDLVAEIKKGSVVTSTLTTIATNYSAFDGASMATPHVSGVVALMKSLNKSLTAAQVKDLLEKTTIDLAHNTKLEVGAGLVDAEAAVMAVLWTAPAK